jgi:hypothetical protein
MLTNVWMTVKISKLPHMAHDVLPLQTDGPERVGHVKQTDNNFNILQAYCDGLQHTLT